MSKEVLPDSTIDEQLDLILRASGSRLANYSLYGILDKMREAMREFEAEVLAAQQEADAKDVDFELICNDEFVASSNDWNELMRYAAQYSEDGPIEVHRVVRTILMPPFDTAMATPTDSEEAAYQAEAAERFNQATGLNQGIAGEK